MADSKTTKLILATGSYDRTIKIWEANTGINIATFPFAEKSAVNALARTPDGKHLVGCGHEVMLFYDLETMSSFPVLQFTKIKKNITCVGFNSSYWMYTGGCDHKLRIWHTKDETPVLVRVVNFEIPINRACLHPNQVELGVATEDGFVHLIDLRYDVKKKIKLETEGRTLDVDISQNGKLMAAVTTSGNCHVWNLMSTEIEKQVSLMEIRLRFRAHDRYATRCKFSPNSRLLITTSSDSTARIWTCDDLTMCGELRHPRPFWVWDVAFTIDSKYLFTSCSDGTVRLWDVDKECVRRIYIGHIKAVTALCYKDEKA